MSDATPAADPVVTCPSCQGEMQRLPLDGQYGARLAIDLCHVCQGFWFDSREDLQLAPAAILQLFEIIHDATGARTPLPAKLPCPRCGLRLLLTDDRQRATRFRYWRCARGHGRYIAFVDFLREKDFVRELTPTQLAELKAQVRSVSCSSCGAPIDLARDTVCSHCHTPLAMLDLAQVGHIVEQLQQSAERAAHPDPTKRAALEMALLRERRQVEKEDLIQGSLSDVVAWLRRLRSS